MASEASELLQSELASLRLRRSTTAEQAADVIRTLILRQKLEPGSPVRELHVARSLGISRNTTREALRILGREGLIVQDRHRVATVTRLRAEDVDDVFLTRTVIECGAVREAIRSGRKRDLSALQAAVERLTNLRGDEPWWEIIEADLGFHVGLVELAHSPRLSTLYAQFEGEIRLCLSITTRTHVSIAEIERQHRTLLRHVRQGDEDAFVKRFVGYVDEARARAALVLRGEHVPSRPQTGDPVVLHAGTS